MTGVREYFYFYILYKDRNEPHLLKMAGNLQDHRLGGHSACVDMPCVCVCVSAVVCLHGQRMGWKDMTELRGIVSSGRHMSTWPVWMSNCRMVAAEAPPCMHVGRACHSAQDDDWFKISEQEPIPTRRLLCGMWWNRDWKASKMLYCTKPDGSRKALFLILEKTEIRERNGQR